MPNSISREAPSFSDHIPSCLHDFFKQFKNLALSCALTDCEKCWMILWYVDTMAKHFWQAIPEYHTGDFKAFKMKNFRNYLGSVALHTDYAAVLR